MDIGLLWYDNDPKRTLPEKLQRAREFYAAKHGRQPTDCHVHPGMLPTGADKGCTVDGLRLVPSKRIMMDHMWLGFESAPLPSLLK